MRRVSGRPTVSADPLNPYGPLCDIAVAMDGCPADLPATGYTGALLGLVALVLVLVGVALVIIGRRWRATLDELGDWHARPEPPRRLGRW